MRENVMSDNKRRPYCYVDHANKKSENYAANPYLFWLRQARRHRIDDRGDAADDGHGDGGRDDDAGEPTGSK